MRSPHAPEQRQYPYYRKCSRRSAEIGGSEGKVPPSSKTPVNAAGTGDAVHLSAELALKGRYPGYELKAEAVVDHGEAAGGKRESSAVNPRNGLSCLSG